jgi:6-pyruvoyltetrahydropterin/6-carboxytetrahydropterin synthase
MIQPSITRSIDIHYAHRVRKHRGKCAKLHGHRGTIEVTLTGPLIEEGSSTGMVLDSGDVEMALEKVKLFLCHRTLLQAGDLVADVLLSGEHDIGSHLDLGYYVHVHDVDLAVLVLLPWEPTAENLARLCFDMLSQYLNTEEIKVQHVKFWETSKFYAQYPGQYT